MDQKKKSAKRWLVIALVLCLVSMIGASVIQTGGGNVTVKDIRWETTVGHRMSGLLFVPKGVDAENPAPAVVVSHGMYNNREMQDLNFVELSRRGFVVLSMDMFSHGNSESYASSSADIVIGMYEAVKMLDSLPYVDSTRIGITGHSLGGMSSNVAVTQDNAAERPLIAAVFLNCADATYQSDGAYVNIYGNRDVGILAAQYDEWFFSQDDGNGGATAPRDFIKNSNAQSFLYYGQDPTGQEPRESGTLYREDIEGEEAIRAVYNPAIIHPWSHFSKQSTAATIEFFDAALGAPISIAPGSQIWQWKVVFNLLGLIGVVLFIVSFAILMVFTPFFSSLRAPEVAKPMALGDKKSKMWFWCSLVACAVFGAVCYLPILKGLQGHVGAKGAVAQSSPVAVGSWAAICGAFAILVMCLSYRMNGKANGMSLADRGVTMPLKNLGKTLLLALIVVTCAYGLVFAADFFFKVDFRVWTIAMKAFEVDKLWVMLWPSLPLFLVYYVANSVAVNSFNYNDIGKKEWVNTAILAAFNALPPVALLLIQYIKFFITGHLMPGFTNMYIVWLFPIAVILPVTAIMTRKIYRVTKNPYLAGLINGIIVTIISCVNTLTWL